jgi:hypothetical protein
MADITQVGLPTVDCFPVLASEAIRTVQIEP